MSVVICLSSYINSSWKSSQSFRKKTLSIMADTRITINCEDHGEECDIIKVTAERDYKPIFTESFLSTEKPLGVHLIEKKVINGEIPGKSAAEHVLSNLLGLIYNGMKIDGKAYTQNEIDLKSQILDFPIIEKFQEIIGYEFDWSKFHNRREFKQYFLELMKKRS